MKISKPLFRDVVGAPFYISAEVLISIGTDETFDKRYYGKIGKVASYEYSGGCGQSYPEDPMIGVAFTGGNIEYFWREELKLIGDDKNKPQPKCRGTETKQKPPARTPGVFGITLDILPI